MTSHPHHIYGEEKLGGRPVNDPASNYHNKVPMPNIIVAQKKCIMYSRVLRPMQKKLLHDLTELVNENKPKYWLTIYLTMFILLHSCSMITRRDWETARLYDSSVSSSPSLSLSLPPPFLLCSPG
jgi:mannose-6-phosphate isomerase class I